MKARLCAAVVAALTMTGLSTVAVADSGTVSWKRIIGIVQAGNVVFGIAGGGQPWSTLGGEALVNLSTGHVEFEVRGLVLAGGDAIGTRAGINQVKGTIACGSDPLLDQRDTPLVPLSAQGEAEFDGTISIPATCTGSNIVFLIRIQSAPTSRWIANGSVRSP